MNSIPHGRGPGEKGDDDTPLDWSRYPGREKPFDVDDESPFDGPGDISSIRCDGRPVDMDSPSFEWTCKPTDRVPGIPEEDVPFKTPDDLGTHPRSSQPREEGPDDTPLDWSRLPGDKKPEEEDFPFDGRVIVHQRDFSSSQGLVSDVRASNSLNNMQP